MALPAGQCPSHLLLPSLHSRFKREIRKNRGISCATPKKNYEFAEKTPQTTSTSSDVKNNFFQQDIPSDVFCRKSATFLDVTKCDNTTGHNEVSPIS
jgi:hypothetical protein